MTSNILYLNSANTEFLLLGHEPQLNKIHNPTLLLTDGNSVPPTAFARNLGFIFDSSFQPLLPFLPTTRRRCHLVQLRGLMRNAIADVMGSSTMSRPSTFYANPGICVQLILDGLKSSYWVWYGDSCAAVPIPWRSLSILC